MYTYFEALQHLRNKGATHTTTSDGEDVRTTPIDIAIKLAALYHAKQESNREFIVTGYAIYSHVTTGVGEHTKEDILELKRTELDAQRLQAEMAGIERRWEALFDAVKDSKEWKEDCYKRGAVENYDFGDVLR